MIDIDPEALAFTVDMVNRVAGREIAEAGAADLTGVDVLINATPVGLKSAEAFPVDLDGLRPDMLVADIAALARETELLKLARQRGCATSGRDMLKAQIGLIAGYAAGLEAGTPL